MQPVLPYERHYDTLCTISQPLLLFVDGLKVVAKSVGWLGLLAVHRQIHRQERSRGAAGAGRFMNPSAFPLVVSAGAWQNSARAGPMAFDKKIGYHSNATRLTAVIASEAISSSAYQSLSFRYLGIAPLRLGPKAGWLAMTRQTLCPDLLVKVHQPGGGSWRCELTEHLAHIEQERWLVSGLWGSIPLAGYGGRL